nr:unnamed protein product [Digitaria exilis]
MAGVPMPEPIPIVDLTRLSAGYGGADEAAKLLSADVGHGMEPDLLAEMMKVTREFYRLPLEERLKYSYLVNGKEFRVQGDVLVRYTAKCREIADLVLATRDAVGSELVDPNLNPLYPVN